MYESSETRDQGRMMSVHEAKKRCRKMRDMIDEMARAGNTALSRAYATALRDEINEVLFELGDRNLVVPPRDVPNRFGGPI